MVKYLNPDVIFNPSVTSIGGGGFSVHTNFKFSIHSNTAWVKHDEVSISKMEKGHTKEIRFLEKVSNKWKLVGQTGPYENNTRIQFLISKQ
jgi:hypothetical protein